MNAAKKNHVGVGLRGLITQTQRIADEMGDFLQLRHLVVVRENDGVALTRELAELLCEIAAIPA